MDRFHIAVNTAYDTLLSKYKNGVTHFVHHKNFRLRELS